MSVQALFEAGRLDDAIQALSAEVRDNPGDGKRRTFLFELLCFSGAFERAEKQLDVLSQGSRGAEMGALLYRSALHAEKNRHELFQKEEYPVPRGDAAGGQTIVSGSINGKSFQSISDADPRIGPHLEVFAAGNYLWIPFSLLSSIEIAAPKRLRDLLWTPAVVRTAPAFQGELGEVLLPVLSPFSAKHSDPNVRLGRATMWEEGPAGEAVPVGQKMILFDEEEVPILEVRKIELAAALAAS